MFSVFHIFTKHLFHFTLKLAPSTSALWPSPVVPLYRSRHKLGNIIRNTKPIVERIRILLRQQERFPYTPRSSTEEI